MASQSMEARIILVAGGSSTPYRIMAAPRTPEKLTPTSRKLSVRRRQWAGCDWIDLHPFFSGTVVPVVRMVRALFSKGLKGRPCGAALVHPCSAPRALPSALDPAQSQSTFESSELKSCGPGSSNDCSDQRRVLTTRHTK